MMMTFEPWQILLVLEFVTVCCQGRGCIAYESFSAPKALLCAVLLFSPVEAPHIRPCPALAMALVPGRMPVKQGNRRCLDKP